MRKKLESLDDELGYSRLHAMLQVDVIHEPMPLTRHDQANVITLSIVPRAAKSSQQTYEDKYSLANIKQSNLRRLSTHPATCETQLGRPLPQWATVRYISSYLNP